MNDFAKAIANDCKDMSTPGLMMFTLLCQSPGTLRMYKFNELYLLMVTDIPPDKATRKGATRTCMTLYTSVTSLCPHCNLPYIASEPDLDQWLGTLREAAVKELQAGKRISL